MSRFDALYANLPVPAQHVALSLYGLYWRWLRFGPGFDRFLEVYQARERLTSVQWQDWQREKLKGMLSLCVDRIPYYRQHWSRREKRAALAGELTELPLLNKEPLRVDPQAFLQEGMHPFNAQVFFTSGSTGTPISSYYTISELRSSMALREARSARWAGVSFLAPRATFSGRMVEPTPDSNGPFYRFNLAERQVYFSAFHLRPETVRRYTDALHRHQIKWATGYAVSFYLLARLMLEEGIPATGLKAVVTTSEKLTPEMRSVMEQAYGCKIYEEYSTVENAVFASECEHGRLHVSPDVSIVEILRPDSTPCSPGEAGEIVVTTLTRTYQPLVRFRLGDMAMWDTEPCPCGRQMPVIKEVVGRIEDVVVGPDGREMVRFHGVFVDQPHVREGQIIQESLDTICVKVVPARGFNELDVQDIIHRIQQRLGDSVKVSVEPVAEIPRTKAGKFQAVISKLKNK